MGQMGPQSQKKRKLGERERTARPKKRIRKQKYYHSSSSEGEDEAEQENEFTPVDLNDSANGSITKPKFQPTGANSTTVLRKQPSISAPSVPQDDDTASDQGSNSDSGSDPSSQSEVDTDNEVTDSLTKKSQRSNKSKRNDPDAFATSITKILSTKLPQSARSDPLLSRSRSAAESSAALANERLEKKARAKIRTDKKEELERGRVKDVLGLETGQAGEVAEEEKKLRKIAQRGVVKLFNAVRAAQVRGEQAMKEERKKGTVGMKNREEKVREVTKEGFLDLISGKKTAKVGAGS